MPAIHTINSIHWMLLRRLLAVWLLVALAVTGIGYYIEVNKFEEGLAAIAAAPPRASIEVLVIDDASRDETSDLLPLVKGIRYLRNDRNLGFLRSINRGATLARGRYLHLLNNDTQVQPGWLDALVAVFREEPDAGLVGSKLIYPSGYLQEAGAALKRDGRVELIGLNAHPADPLIAKT